MLGFLVGWCETICLRGAGHRMATHHLSENRVENALKQPNIIACSRIGNLDDCTR
jgi:hypothetical protein